MKKRFTRSLRRLVRTQVTWHNATGLLLIIVATGLLLFRLGSLTPGLAATEQPLPHVTTTLHTIWNNPINLPFTLAQLVVAVVLPTGGYTSSRLPSVLMAGLLLFCLFWLFKQWYGRRLALFGVLLLMTSPWLLHVARLANGAISYPLAMAGLLGLAALWHRQAFSQWLLYATAVLSSLMLYIPGMIWLQLVVILFEQRSLRAAVLGGKYKPWQLASAAAAGVILLVPLVHRLITHWHDLFLFLGGQPGQETVSALAGTAKHYPLVWLHIFVGGWHEPLYNVGGLAVVSLFIALAFVVGIQMYGRHWHASRSQMLLALWLVATGLIALPSSINNALLLPIVFVLATGGIGYLLHIWLKVFPRNPFARGFGIGLIALVVIFGMAYNLRNYYVAWPHTPATRAAFTQRL